MPSILWNDYYILLALLRPLLDFQLDSARYKNNFAAPDLGSGYPNALGNTDTNAMRAIDGE